MDQTSESCYKSCSRIRVQPVLGVAAMVTKCLEAQGGASSSKAFSLSKELRDYIASNAYRIAKIIATKADYEVPRRHR